MGAIVRRGRKIYAQYRDADGVRRTKLLKGATSLEWARILLAAIELRISQGTVGIEQPTEEELSRRSITVKKLGEKFLAEYANPKVKDLKAYRALAKWKVARISKKIGQRAAASLTVADVERFRDELLAGGLGPASTTRHLAVLSKMFAWGRKAGVLAVDSPTRGCVRPTETPSLDYLSREEVAKLLEHAEQAAPIAYPMIATAVFTGMRKGELFGLRWLDVHLDAGRLDVIRSYRTAPKSGKARHLPLHPELVRILRVWKERCAPTEEGLVFPVHPPARSPRMGLQRETLGLAAILGAAGCHEPDHPWHALRHSFASHFVMAGGNILELQKLLGHSTLAMTMVYAHLSPDHLAAGVARMSFALPPPAGVSQMEEARRLRAL